ncbi:hypothetical protein [Pseudomonas frederiksbergensis]|uniref:hypothetical protein n=1 Tax=Pseudomonas frederiksbergensis TaxID=104087 RepID=UPI003D1FE5FC
MEEHAFTLPKPAESGFHIVQTPMTLEALERSLFEITPSDVLRREFRSLNRHLGERVKLGQMVIFSDSRNYMCRREEAQMMAAAEKVNEALKDLADEEASFMVEHHEVIEPFWEFLPERWVLHRLWWASIWKRLRTRLKNLSGYTWSSTASMDT